MPASEDAFGGHARVARAIATLLKQEEGGKSIALLGSWGSGKSTVVNILENEFKDSKETAVFVFDAWAHEGDPLRRSFLEKLIDYLSCIGWIPKREWKETKEILAKRIKITTTTTYPRLTLGGIFFAIAALLVPIGLALVRDQDLPQFVPSWLGYALVVSPLLVIVFILTISLIKSICKVLWATIGWIRSKPPDLKRVQSFIDSVKKSDWSKDWRNVLSLLISKSEVDERNEAIETPDPTSIEFKKYFQGILEEALESFKERRLLIVIDNLDRANVNTAMSIWATMRTFFEYSEFNPRPKWMERLWLLVPFSPEAPQRLWKEMNRYNGRGKYDNSEQRSLTDSVEEKSLADEFIDKTFQIVFHVPLPIMSDWKEFFKEQLVQALPKHEEDSYPIYRIFEKKRIHHNRPPTPREIKLFINKLGAYHRIWQDKIPLSIQAWYVLEVSERLKFGSPETVLLNKELLNDDLRGVIKERDWQKYLAALYFNVDIDKAMQVLIGDEIKEYLVTGHGKRLRELEEKVESQSFLTVLEHIIADNYRDWLHEEPSALARSALALKALGQTDSPEWQRIREYLLEGAREGNWSDLNEEVGQGLLAILEMCPDSRYEDMVQAILEHIAEPEAQSNEEETAQVAESMIIEHWAKGLVVVLRAIHQAGHGEFIREHFKIPGNEKFYVEVMCALAQLKVDEDVTDLTEYFVPAIEADQIITHLATLCNQKEFDESYAHGLQLMLKFDFDWNWTRLIQAVRERLTFLNVLELPELRGLLRALLSLESEKVTEAQNELQNLSMNGVLMHHLNYAYDSRDHEAVGLCLMPILKFVPQANIQNQQGQTPQGCQKYNEILGNPSEDVVATFANEVCEFQKADELLEKAAKVSNIQKIVSGVMESIIQQEDVHEHLSSSSVVEHYDLLQEMLSIEGLQSLIRQLVEKGDLLREITEEYEFNKDLVEFYLQILEVSQRIEDSKEFIEFLVEGLRGLSEEAWLEKLNEEDHLIALVIVLVKEGISIELTDDFHDALLEHAQGILSQEATVTELEDEWALLLGALTSFQRKTFLRNLRDELISQADITQTPILKLYGQVLLKGDVIKEEADQVVRRWFTQMLDRQDEDELSWIAEVLGKQPQVFTQSKPETQQTFRQRVQNAWEETEDSQVKKHLKSIAKSIGLEPKQEVPESEREESNSKSKGEE